MGKYKFKITITIIVIITIIFSTNVYGATIEVANYTELEKVIIKQLNLTYSDFNISYKGTAEEIDKILKGLIEKEPYLKCTITSLEWTSTETSKGNFNIYIKANYIMSSSERKEADNKINNILADIIKPNMTEHEKVKTVHDYIILNGKYDTNFENYSDYDLLTKGKSVCNGYAILTYNMLRKLDIPVKLVFGTSNSQLHVWNIVKLGDYWFHLDTTWDDPVPDKKNIVSYNYYLLTEEEILKDHKIDKNQNLPNSKYRYYSYLKDLAATSQYSYIYKRLLVETGLDIYDKENTADTKDGLKSAFQKKINFHPSKISVRLNKVLTKEDINNAMSNLFEIKSISEISYDQITNDNSNYSILNLYIKYKEVPDCLETDISSKVYNIATKVNYTVYAVYGTRKENITNDVLVYPYDTSFVSVNKNTLIFNDAGNHSLTFEYEGKKLDVPVTAINSKGFDYITDEKSKNPINVKIYNKYIDFKAINQWPFIEDGRTLVPLRAVFEVLNCEVKWDSANSSAIVEHRNTKIVIPANSKIVYVNGTSMSLDVPARLVNNRIMVPLRFISESISKKVIWDDKDSTVLIY